jgi:hypothetical protein
MEIKFAYLDDQRSRKEKILPRRGVIACDFVQSLSCPWYKPMQ